ncbi:MAG: hypothetical protein IPN71_16475 [Fibrobacteres bacterium]|nr:hypothetical protein [Fibrobacterota bacterium]
MSRTATSPVRTARSPKTRNDASSASSTPSRIWSGSWTGWAPRRNWLDLRDPVHPYGEALIHPWYQSAMVRLSRMAHVESGRADQSFLVYRLDGGIGSGQAAFWATFHPGQAEESVFLNDVGSVGSGHSPQCGRGGPEGHFPAIDSLRRTLPDSTYMWSTPSSARRAITRDSEIAHLESIDPYFRHNLPHYQTLGRDCRTGSEVLAIEGNGDLLRCHFDKTVRGNIFQQELRGNARRALRPGHLPLPHRLCPCTAFGDGGDLRRSDPGADSLENAP